MATFAAVQPANASIVPISLSVQQKLPATPRGDVNSSDQQLNKYGLIMDVHFGGPVGQLAEVFVNKFTKLIST